MHACMHIWLNVQGSIFLVWSSHSTELLLIRKHRYLISLYIVYPLYTFYNFTRSEQNVYNTHISYVIKWDKIIDDWPLIGTLMKRYVNVVVFYGIACWLYQIIHKQAESTKNNGHVSPIVYRIKRLWTKGSTCNINFYII